MLKARYNTFTSNPSIGGLRDRWVSRAQWSASLVTSMSPRLRRTLSQELRSPLENS